jgi:hypothetical protein
MTEPVHGSTIELNGIAGRCWDDAFTATFANW